MFSTLRTRFGIPGVISVIALVFAMLGGAYAANNSGGGKATASAKAKKGPRGPKGATGPAGPQGPAGPAGAKGDAGAAGSNGSNGAPGADGKSVTGVPATVGECPAGGVKYTSASGTNTVCNGKNGTNGQTGFTEVLPEGKTETGVWGTGTQTSAGKRTFPISFPIPLAEAPTTVLVPANKSSEPGCPGRGGGDLPPSSSGEEEYFPTAPEADPGMLCIYIDAMSEATEATIQGGTTKRPVYNPVEEVWAVVPGTTPVGAFLDLNCTESCVAQGTWAVTAEE